MDKKLLTVWYICAGLYCTFVILMIINQIKESRKRNVLYKKANQFFAESEVIPEKSHSSRSKPKPKTTLKVEK